MNATKSWQRELKRLKQFSNAAPLLFEADEHEALANLWAKMGEHYRSFELINAINLVEDGMGEECQAAVINFWELDGCPEY